MMDPADQQAAEPPREVRLGPMVWVPGWSAAGPRDKWAHRKGEPRHIALFWSIYLMASAILTIFALRSLSVPTTLQFAHGCRAMLVMAALGLTVLWPMTRLSQEYPPRPRRALLADLLVLIVPVQAVIWPMPLLTHWTWTLNAALALCLTSWAVLMGGVLVHASLTPWHSARCLWAMVILALACWPWTFFLLGNRGWDGMPIAARMGSAPSAMLQLVTAPSGLSPSIAPVEWLLCCLPLAAGLLLFAAGTSHGTPKRSESHSGAAEAH